MKIRKCIKCGGVGTVLIDHGPCDGKGCVACLGTGKVSRVCQRCDGFGDE